MSHWTSKALGKTTYPIKAGTNHSAEISHQVVEPLACVIQPSSHKGTKRWATKPPRHRATKPLSHRATEPQATKQDSNMPRDLSDFLLVLGLLVGSPVCSFALGGRVCSTAPRRKPGWRFTAGFKYPCNSKCCRNSLSHFYGFLSVFCENWYRNERYYRFVIKSHDFDI